MTPAEELKAAAIRLRPTPVDIQRAEDGAHLHMCRCGPRWAYAINEHECRSHPFQSAVADWLEGVATELERRPIKHTQRALAVARAVNGEPRAE